VGINSSGQVVGYYEDSSAHTLGFVESGGHYTTIDPFGSIYAPALGINDSGQVVGYYIDEQISPGGGISGSGIAYGFLATPTLPPIVEADRAHA
jgi:hypothetical protein